MWMMYMFGKAALRAAYIKAGLAAEADGSKGLHQNPIADLMRLQNERPDEMFKVQSLHIVCVKKNHFLLKTTNK